MPQLIPVTIVTGFLGSGKTTLLSNLLGRVGARRLAILVNEFGEVSIDGAVLREHEHEDERKNECETGCETGRKTGRETERETERETKRETKRERGARSGSDARAQVEFHELSNGLVAYGDDDGFVPAMTEMYARRSRIDHVLIETSGLAAPTGVMAALQGEALCDKFVLDATLVVVDTPLFTQGHFSAEQAPAALVEVFHRQLEFADVVVLNKIDTLEQAALLEVETRLRAHAPGVRFFELAWQARLDPRVTLGLRLHEAAAHDGHHGAVRYAPAGGGEARADQRVFDGHAHGGGAPHVHGLATHKHFHTHDPGWQSFVLRSMQLQDEAALQRACAAVARAHPVLRLKGFAAVAGAPRRLLVQGVRERLEARWAQAEATDTQSELVLIGYHPSRPQIRDLLSEMTGTRWQ